MTLATLVHIPLETLERIKADLAELSAGSNRCGVWGEECPMQDVGKSYHAIRTTVEAIDAAIREAERRETGERPEIRVGDYVLARGPSLGDYGYVDHQPQADYWKEPENAERVVEICRPLWRQEAPTP